MLAILLLLCIATGPALLEPSFNFPPLDTEQLTVGWWPDNRNFDEIQESCDFSKSCRYGSHESKWKYLKGSLSVPNYQSYLSSSDMPRLPAIGFGSKSSDSAHLLSDPLPCLTDSIFQMSVWAWGLWRLQLCVLDFKTGKFKSCGTAFNGNDSSLNIFTLYQEITREPLDFDHLAVVISADVRNGFVILDDLKFNGTKCAEHQSKGTANLIIDNKIVSDVSFVRKEILTVLSRQIDLFSRYLINAYHNSVQFSARRSSTLCRSVPCNFDCDWRNYSMEDGLLVFKRQRVFVKNEMDSWQQIALVAHFTANAISYASVMSPKFFLAPSSKFIIDADYYLTFLLNRAACEKQVIVCFYKTPESQNVRSECRESPCQGDSHQEWFRFELKLPKKIERFQIVILKRQPTDYEFDESVLRDVNILGC